MSSGSERAAPSPEVRLAKTLDATAVGPVPGPAVFSPEYWVGEGRHELFAFLRNDVFPQLAPPPYGDIEVFGVSDRKPVYLFRETGNKIAVAGKFRFHGPVSLDKAWEITEKEFANLALIRWRLGTDSPYSVAAPLGKKKELSALLVTEQARGKTLDHYIAAAVHEQQQSRLIEKLGLLARFFSLLHARTLSRTSTSFDYPAGYLAHMLALFRERTVFGAEAGAIQEEADKWWAKPELMSDCEVLVHRDATPTNFLFSGRQVTGIDLDKMRMADRCWDLGFIAAELKHHFLWRTGDPWGAEPYIGHFLREYAAGLPYGGRFADITRRTPLFMGLGLARIARNEWLGEAYRRRLLVEAGLCLKYGR